MYSLLLLSYYCANAIVIDRTQVLQKHDLITVLVRPEQRTTAYAWLRDAGFVPADAVKHVAVPDSEEP